MAISFQPSAISPDRIVSARSWDQRLLTMDYGPEIKAGRSAYALRSALSALLPGSVLSIRYSLLISRQLPFASPVRVSEEFFEQ